MIEDAIINAAQAVSKEELIKLLDTATPESIQKALLKVARQENTEETILALVDLMDDELVIELITNAAINREIDVAIRICEETEPALVLQAIGFLLSQEGSDIVLENLFAAMPEELVKLLDAEVEEVSLTGDTGEV